MGTRAAKAFMTPPRGDTRNSSRRRRLDGLAARRGKGRALPPRFTASGGCAGRAASAAFVEVWAAELELDPGFDDFDGLDGQVDVLFANSRREATGTRFADGDDA